MLLMASLIQVSQLWTTYNRLNEVALLSARMHAADSALPAARLRAHRLQLNPLKLWIEVEEQAEVATAIARYPIEPAWMARIVVLFGRPPWLEATQQAQSLPSARQRLHR